ncbi:MAG: hopanoid biosynthesis associated radical SAM protein HpnJ [Armatimonadetes bacterium]|nr:hopanoid biosynthesis associated radical SAM protein HpnJ [Armatimonadota bacterium]
MRKTLFLNAPSYAGFDGGAGARYQARREVRSYWYPTWLAQPAALVPGSRLVDAPPHGQSWDEVLDIAADHELVVLHTSTPGFGNDVRFVEALKSRRPDVQVGLCGAHTAVNPTSSLEASEAIDFVCNKEYDFTLLEVAQGRDLAEITGLSYRQEGRIRHNAPRAEIGDMDVLPSVLDVYREHLDIAKYFIGYLMHPYVSFYTGRGCRSKCSFCLWPQTIGGHTYRVQSAARVAAEVARVAAWWPEVKEVFFDDDTFTDDRERTEEVARLLGPIGLRWSCNAKANVPFETLQIMRDNGCRLLLVGFESGDQEILNNIRKGIRIDRAREFVAHCKTLGIAIHGTFIVGLPGETAATIQQTIRFAKEMDLESLQVSLAAPYPGTELYQQAIDNGWFDGDPVINASGIQVPALRYDGLTAADMNAAVEEFYKRFYFRPRVLWRMIKPMLTDADLRRRRLREGREFLGFFGQREESSAACP